MDTGSEIREPLVLQTQTQTRYEQNREKLLAYQNKYYKENQTTPEYREKRKAYMKAYHQKKKAQTKSNAITT